MDRDFDKKDGKWFPVMNELAEKLCTYELTKIEHRALWMFFRFCYGNNSAGCELRYTDMLDITQLPESSLTKALKGLKKRKIIIPLRLESRTYTTYRINSKLSSWKDPKSTDTNVAEKHHKQSAFTPQTEITPYKRHKQKHNSVFLENTPQTERKQNGSKKAKKDKLEIPDWIDSDLWIEFKKYRQRGKGKFTPFAQKLAVGKLADLRAAGNDPNEVIKQSILMGWTGLFEIKKEIREETKVKQITNKKLEKYMREISL